MLAYRGTPEQEVVALIDCGIGGGYNSKGNFWEMAAQTPGVVFCDTGKVSTKEERLAGPVTDEERGGKKGWGAFWQRADLPPEDPQKEGRIGAKSGGAALVHL